MNTHSELDGLKILVVDDEEDAREILSVLLTRAGGEIETAASAPEGFDKFIGFRPHVVVSDIGMPLEDGYSFIQRIRQLSSDEGGRTPSIALTAFTRIEDRRKALSAGFDQHLGKPVDLDRLISELTTLTRSP